MSLVNSYFLKPAFDGGSYDVVLGEKIVLNDLNHALSNYEVVSDNAYIDGDTLVVNVKELGNKDILLSRKKYDDLSSIYYYASNSQDFMFLHIFCNIARPHFILFGLYLGGIVVTYP